MKILSSVKTAVAAGLFICVTIIVAFSASPAFAARSTATAITPLSATEASVLTFMREEEKMARDVYINMYKLWNAVTFSNISASEQKHMDTMKKMLDKYKLPDPAQDAIGVFTDANLQAKYDELMASGTKSYVDGLYVGATIEEIDMMDIQHAIDVTTHLDVVNAYQNLLEGSKNHLRAFVNALNSQGVTYAPQFISQELYDAIIDL
ncbi:MAG: DUF2202 domain-containing protein [Geobacteraceae bacterium]|nr:DUF2202 domain-containing protein [Geobacteraceae bacterium]NTW81180.1 DUF2202 domain-containing protein [Geobacteraceae bacterium]